MLAIVRKCGNKTIVDSIVNNIDEGKNLICQYAKILNCPQKIIWIGDSHFKLLSFNGTTEEVFLTETNERKSF